MAIWNQVWGAIKGGWKTHSPGASAVPGAFDSGIDGTYDSVTASTAMNLAAVWACMNLRAETLATLPFHLRDADKNIIKDHPAYSVIHDAPNSMMTAAEYWSLCGAHLDMHGNAISIIQRRTRDKSVISLEPVDPTNVTMEQSKTGAWSYKIPGMSNIPAENILHLRGFSMDGQWGLPRIDIGRQILSAQLSANESAVRAFKQGLKVGGFFEQNGEGNGMDTPQLEDFRKRLNEYGRPENAGKFMVLLKGMKPIGGADFRVKPADAELLSSRYFGIEEICRLFNTPPQLIGHTDKASSWASSMEQINLFFLMYSMQPSFIRIEQRVSLRLLSSEDRAKGIRPKFSVEGLLRSDLKTRQTFYASGLQNGYLSRNEVRDLEERGNIDGGDEYTVQLNMTGVDNLGGKGNKP